ncbi:MAG: ATP-binding protein [Aureliella sp.]
MRPSTIEHEPTVLVVDDHPENLELLSTFLESNGYAVRASTSAAEAIRSADIDPPSLILLDVNMPDINGFEACRILKENESTEPVPVIFISADDSPKQRLMGFDCGAIDYISAPFVLEEVEARICARLEVEEFRKRDRERAVAFEALLRDQIVLDRQQRHILNLLVHDLKNPLQAISSTFEILERECGSGASNMATSINEGIDACRSMSEMVDRLPEQRHDLSDALVINKHTSRFSMIARAARAMIPDATNVAFEIDTDCDVWCDKSIISRVLVNLVNNAIEHGGQGTQVVVECTADDLQATFQVSDNGAGIAKEELDSIFPAYDMNHATHSNDYSLGLAFCRLAIDGHQGTIEVESQPGHGSKVTIQLPANLELEDDDCEMYLTQPALM